VVDRDEAGLHRRDLAEGLLHRRPEPLLHEAFEIRLGLPDVEDDPAALGWPGVMRDEALWLLLRVPIEVLHDRVVALGVHAGRLDEHSDSHVSPLVDEPGSYALSCATIWSTTFGQNAQGRFASQLWGSPSQQPSFNLQRGHCQVPWIH